MPLPSIIRPDARAVGETVAAMIVERLSTSGTAPFLLGCPSGRTANPTYMALARHAAAGVDLSRLVFVMMDEYLEPGPDGDDLSVDPERSYSCLGFARRDIVGPIAQACAQAGTEAPTEVWVPDPADPADYDRRIQAAGGIAQALVGARRVAPHLLKIEVECETLAQVREALNAGADAVLLDNMEIELMRRAVKLVREQAPHLLIEASGNIGVDPERLAAVAATGVDFISLGALTHSAPNLDVSLEFA